MSRIGAQIISIPAGVEVKVQDRVVTAKGPKGTLSFTVVDGIDVELKDGQISVKNLGGKELNKFHGLARAMIANIVKGTSVGFEKSMEVVGVGYRANAQGDKLVLQLGYSHPIEVVAPQGISFAVEKNKITVSGIDKQLVGQVAAVIRSKRPPEPYKGKGIKYEDERVRRKAGKAAAKAGEGA